MARRKTSLERPPSGEPRRATRPAERRHVEHVCPAGAALERCHGGRAPLGTPNCAEAGPLATVRPCHACCGHMVDWLPGSPAMDAGPSGLRR